MALTFFPCPYLGSLVELNDERERHITDRHPELMTRRPEYVAPTLAYPDRVQISPSDAGVRLFTRWYNDLGKYVVVAVVIDAPPRYWIITARIARRPARGETEWSRN